MLKMATQKVNRFCYSCEELYNENDRFCIKYGDKRIWTLDSKGNNGLIESKISKSLDVYIKEKGKERRGSFKPKFLQNVNKPRKSNRKAPDLLAEVVVNVDLIETNENDIVSIKRGSRLAIKLLSNLFLKKI